MDKLVNKTENETADTNNSNEITDKQKLFNFTSHEIAGGLSALVLGTSAFLLSRKFMQNKIAQISLAGVSAVAFYFIGLNVSLNVGSKNNDLDKIFNDLKNIKDIGSEFSQSGIFEKNKYFRIDTKTPYGIITQKYFEDGKIEITKSYNKNKVNGTWKLKDNEMEIDLGENGVIKKPKETAIIAVTTILT